MVMNQSYEEVIHNAVKKCSWSIMFHETFIRNACLQSSSGILEVALMYLSLVIKTNFVWASFQRRFKRFLFKLWWLTPPVGFLQVLATKKREF